VRCGALHARVNTHARTRSSAVTHAGFPVHALARGSIHKHRARRSRIGQMRDRERAFFHPHLFSAVLYRYETPTRGR